MYSNGTALDSKAIVVAACLTTSLLFLAPIAAVLLNQNLYFELVSTLRFLLIFSALLALIFAESALQADAPVLFGVIVPACVGSVCGVVSAVLAPHFALRESPFLAAE